MITGLAGHNHGEIMARVGDVEDGSVHFTGFVPQEELVTLYRKADALLYLSLKEGFGLPPLEAMASGTPVIASNLAPITEVMGNAGVFADPASADDIAEKIRTVVTDGEVASELIARGLERARVLSWERAARGAIRVYERVAC